MLTLAFDTATSVVTVALLHSECVLAEQTTDGPTRHGELLAPLIAATLAAAGTPIADIEMVAVGVGPGPFTGLRVGLVTALALGDALGVPVRGICSLDALGGETDAGGEVVAVTDARRREVYWARYAAGARVAGPAVDLPAVLSERLRGECSPPAVTGPGADLYAEVLTGLVAYPGRRLSAAGLGQRALAGHGLLPPVPLYLRRPDAVASRGARGVTP